jgi:ubiquinone/menaquinone biosynthesis C-methylase UbiE
LSFIVLAHGRIVAYEKFDVKKLERLNDEARFGVLQPDVMWQALGDPDPLAIVDIGAGTGLFARRFAEMASQAQVYAVDAAPVMVDWMLDNMPESLRGRLHPVLGQETTVPLTSGEADLVVMIHLHHELAEPLSSYREALRLLRPGGQILVVDWAQGDDPTGPPQHIRASADLMTRMLEDAGFEVVVTHQGLPKDSMLTARKPTA